MTRRTKPSIKWDGHVFRKRPVINVYLWLGQEFAVAKAFASYVPGDCYWKDSLVERPSKGVKS